MGIFLDLASFAIPSEVIQPLLVDFMSGKLAPKKE